MPARHPTHLVLAALALLTVPPALAGSGTSPAALLPATVTTAAPTAMPSANAALVLRLVRDGLERRDTATVRRLVAPDYREHDPQRANGRAALLAALCDPATPRVRYDVIRTLVDGDLVILHSRVTLTGTPKPLAAFDIYRVRDGQVTEHWVNRQPNADAPNPSGRTLLDGETRVTDSALTAQNKATVKAFYTRLFLQGDLSALQTIDPDTYLQHNPGFADGVDTIRRAFGGMAAAPAAPGHAAAPANTAAAPSPQPLAVSGEGNFVLVRTVSSFGGGRSLVYDLFRLHSGRIVEHWDIVSPVPATASNSSGVF
ncbi:nuclear transport factor 2 family protein [Deinococcus aquiradiocola]|uniref:Polyketide cyclase n=1 Tax=Deinococcus aquiradiocola TaxID=393059 RepID=A0A917PIP7_9DEIO|nr:nuclear transport factor 2 family protein [Deinococcus aquiradiocola]GGJ80872.1 polyketide cyclase [Deinococcus aquiradiocola]